MASGLAAAVTVALALALALAAFAGWLWLVRRLYRLRAAPPERLRATCADGWELALYHRAARPRRFAEPVLLAHGLAANHLSFDLDPPHSIAQHLADAGFDVYSIEWRGTGGSSRPPPGRRRYDFCVDHHIRLDAAAFIAQALAHSGAARAFWLGHSLGGLVGYGAAQEPHGAQLAGVLALGSPVFFRHDPVVGAAVKLGPLLAWPFPLWGRTLSLGIAPWLGWVALPYTDVVVNPRNITGRLQRQALAHVINGVGRSMLLQLRDWSRHDAFRSRDGVDYRAGLTNLRLPVLVMAGARDRLATADSARAQFEQVGSPDKTLVVFGREHGDREDYGHGDLLFGERAPDEVYPLIRRWLTDRATAVPAQSAETAQAGGGGPPSDRTPK
jgi:pimeloyl-ACP methyl ester carboxylesterase